ncbi:hypothetical protein Tco_0739918 [Tanacetum coccineum]
MTLDPWAARIRCAVSNGKLARVKVFTHKVVSSKPKGGLISPLRIAAPCCGCLLRATVCQPLTGDQPPLAGGPAVVNGGPPPLTVVNCRWSRLDVVRGSAVMRFLEADVAASLWWIEG